MASTVVKAVLAINQCINKCRGKKLKKTYFQLSFLHLVQFRTCLPKCKCEFRSFRGNIIYCKNSFQVNFNLTTWPCITGKLESL